jgi:hypothetical protein
VVRSSKTTKEIDQGELEQLKKPEARETAAFDPSELQGLIAASIEEDDLALPVESSNSAPMPAPPVLAASSGVAAIPVSSMLAASSSGLEPIPVNDFEDVPGHHYSTDVPPSSTTPPRVARGSARTPKEHRPLTRPSMPTTSSSLLPWILVAIAVAIVVALALWS